MLSRKLSVSIALVLSAAICSKRYIVALFTNSWWFLKHPVRSTVRSISDARPLGRLSRMSTSLFDLAAASAAELRKSSVFSRIDSL